MIGCAQSWEGYPPELRALAGDSIGASRPCDAWWIQAVTVGGFLGGCRDSVDVQRLTEGWTSLAADMANVRDAAQQVAAFAGERRRYEAWYEAEIVDGSDFTTDGAEIHAIDQWGARLQAWRDWYESASGKMASGPAVVETKTAGGLGVALDKLTTAAIVIGVVYVGLQFAKR